MTEKPDAQLLRKFAEDRDDDAFRDIVNRYADLVYSAALRQVESPDLAADIAQSVFLDLARKAREVAGNMGSHGSLVGWLYRGTRFAVLKHLRDDHRRASHERQAMEQLLTNTESSPDWNEVRPILDEAMAGLSDDDREAILLRYFQNRDFRAVGAALGISDDTAQKRVSRAVDRLRELFAKRGVAVGAGGLAIALTANAIQAAPVGLSMTISATALAGTSFAGATATSTVIKTIAMTTVQKTVLTAAFALVAGLGVYEARQASQLQAQNLNLQQQQLADASRMRQLQDQLDATAIRLAALSSENGQLKTNRDDSELLKLRAEVTRLRASNSSPSLDASDPRSPYVRSWLEREQKLRQLARDNPAKTIPEMQLLNSNDWLNAAMNANFDTDHDQRQNLANLRQRAENDFVGMLSGALADYGKANNGAFPTDLSQLQPYFKTPVDYSMLNRWTILPQSDIPNQSMGGNWVVTEKSPVDPAFDQRWAVGQGSYGEASYLTGDVNLAMNTLEPVINAYAAANNGQQPTDPTQIAPYLSTPDQQAAYQKVLARYPTNPATGKVW